MNIKLSIRNLVIGVIIIFLLCLVTCNAGRISEYFHKKESDKTLLLTSARTNAEDSVTVSKSQYAQLVKELETARVLLDSTIEVAKTSQKVAKTSIIKVVREVGAESKEQVKHKIDSIQQNHANELLADFLTSKAKDDLIKDCETENEALTKENEGYKKEVKSADNVIAKDSSLQKADDNLIKHEEAQSKKSKFKNFIAKTGLWITTGYATITTAIIAAIKYSPPK